MSTPGGSEPFDARTVKHSVIDASSTKGGGPALTLAGLAAAYDWISRHPELKEQLLKIPAPVIVAVVVGGLGWWILLFLARLIEKRKEEY
jgi:ribose/xylose/arabinose/galactoside ABC-type transport system permease subunit|tara:strand:- start:3170 stop:3439 length:270 start_codon:yes stop_codon:yes gene_type:complete